MVDHGIPWSSDHHFHLGTSVSLSNVLIRYIHAFLFEVLVSYI